MKMKLSFALITIQGQGQWKWYKMVEINGDIPLAGMAGMKKLWLKRLHHNFNTKLFAIQDGWTNATRYIDPYNNHMIKNTSRHRSQSSLHEGVPVFVCLSVCLSVFLSVCLSLCLSVCLSLSLSLSACLSVCLSVCLSLSLSLSTLSLSLSLSPSLCVCVQIFEHTPYAFAYQCDPKWCKYRTNFTDRRSL